MDFVSDVPRWWVATEVISRRAAAVASEQMASTWWQRPISQDFSIVV